MFSSIFLFWIVLLKQDYVVLICRLGAFRMYDQEVTRPTNVVMITKLAEAFPWYVCEVIY